MLVMFLVAFVRIVIVVVVLDRTNGCITRMVRVAYVCGRSGAKAHEVLSTERNKHHK